MTTTPVYKFHIGAQVRKGGKVEFVRFISLDNDPTTVEWTQNSVSALRYELKVDALAAAKAIANANPSKLISLRTF